MSASGDSNPYNSKQIFTYISNLPAPPCLVGPPPFHQVYLLRCEISPDPFNKQKARISLLTDLTISIEMEAPKKGVTKTRDDSLQLRPIQGPVTLDL